MRERGLGNTGSVGFYRRSIVLLVKISVNPCVPEKGANTEARTLEIQPLVSMYLTRTVFKFYKLCADYGSCSEENML